MGEYTKDIKEPKKFLVQKH